MVVGTGVLVGVGVDVGVGVGSDVGVGGASGIPWKDEAEASSHAHSDTIELIQSRNDVKRCGTK